MNKIKKYFFSSIIITIFCFMPGISYAFSLASFMDIKSPPTPPQQKKPVKILTGISILKISDIDQIEEVLVVEAYIDLKWNDPRKSFDVNKYGKDSMVYIHEELKALLYGGKIWWPEMELINARGKRNIEEQALIIHHDGRINYKERFSATLDVDFKLRNFPFDSQVFFIELASFIYDDTIIKLVADPNLIKTEDDLGEEEWQLTKLTGTVEERKSIHSTKDKKYSSYFLRLYMKREVQYYVLRFFVPIFLIIMIFMGTIWLKDYEVQLSCTTTALLTLIAFEFAISAYLPKLAYLTFFDSCIMFSFTLAAIAVLINLLLVSTHKGGNEEYAHRINHIVRWAFPSVFVIGSLMICINFFY